MTDVGGAAEEKTSHKRRLNLGEATPFHLEVHPSKDLLAVATVQGEVVLTELLEDLTFKEKARIKAHEESCRMVCYNRDGSKFYSCSADCAVSIGDTEKHKIQGSLKAAHTSGVNSMALYDGKMLITGDDEGFVSVWDARSGMKKIWSLEEHGDFVSEICCVENKKTVLVTSGDGTLSTYDVRKGKVEAMSDPLDDELLCVLPVKNDTRVVCGASSGALEIFEWGWFGLPCDRFLDHSESVDTLCVLDTSTICTGSSDGQVRIVSLYPNSLEGTVGEHDGPVECVRVSPHSGHIISCGHDNFVRVWIKNQDQEGEEEKSQETLEPSTSSGVEPQEAGDKRRRGTTEADNSSDDEDSDDSPKVKKKKRRKKKGTGSKKKTIFFDGL